MLPLLIMNLAVEVDLSNHWSFHLPVYFCPTDWFSCPEEKQSNLVDKTFWVIDYFDNVPSKYAQDRYLFKIKFNLEYLYDVFTFHSHCR